MKRKPLVVANWKMHGQKAWIEGFIREFMRALGPLDRGEVVLCPPFVFLAQLQDALRQTRVGLGAQNVHSAEQGAFTGEVSAPMLKELDCSHVIVGHSERRTLFGESDAAVAARFTAAVKGGLVPILCVGENAAERHSGATEERVRAQLDAVTELAGIAAFTQAVIAYEPVWAIGTGNTATPAQAQAVHAFIRSYLAGHDEDVAARVRILYGGSVRADNAARLAAEPDIDGALVGGASMVVKDFLAICAGFGI